MRRCRIGISRAGGFHLRRSKLDQGKSAHSVYVAGLGQRRILGTTLMPCSGTRKIAEFENRSIEKAGGCDEIGSHIVAS